MLESPVNTNCLILGVMILPYPILRPFVGHKPVVIRCLDLGEWKTLTVVDEKPVHKLKENVRWSMENLYSSQWKPLRRLMENPPQRSRESPYTGWWKTSHSGQGRAPTLVDGKPPQWSKENPYSICRKATQTHSDFLKWTSVHVTYTSTGYLWVPSIVDHHSK